MYLYRVDVKIEPPYDNDIEDSRYISLKEEDEYYLELLYTLSDSELKEKPTPESEIIVKSISRYTRLCEYNEKYHKVIVEDNKFNYVDIEDLKHPIIIYFETSPEKFFSVNNTQGIINYLPNLDRNVYHVDGLEDYRGMFQSITEYREEYILLDTTTKKSKLYIFKYRPKGNIKFIKEFNDIGFTFDNV